jgi:acetolactate synthase-1/2/3 large subunit
MPSFDATPFLARLSSAMRPLILAGPSSCTKQGRERMARVEESTGVPVVCMESPRGVADPSLGAFAEILAQADCILLLGKRLDFTLKFGRMPAMAERCEFLQVDPEDDEIRRTRRAVGERLLHSAIANVSDAAQAFAKQATPAKSGWGDEVRSAIEFRPAAWEGATSSLAQRLHPVQALRPMQALLDAHPDSVFVSDGGEFGQWAQACLRAPHRLINGVAGAIGPALPFAIAARLARPNAPVIAAMGDGTFGFHASEIDTAVRYARPFLAIVGNDARWNAEHQIQVRDYGAARALGTDLVPTRYDEVARGFGGYGELVTEPRALMDSARRALASGLPAVLNVMIEGVAAPNIKR